LFIFIGATTENPSFEMNSALLSRAAVYVLQPLSEEDLETLFKRALEGPLHGLSFTDDARALVVGFADGDARRLLNMLEQIADAARAQQNTEIDEDYVRQTLASKLRRFDKGGDAFYDQISALHKSVRGSAPDAALYWLCRMLDGGADPLYMGRRLVRMAIEDIGLADPNTLVQANAAKEVYDFLGSPEGELALAQVTIYLALAPKSNAAYVAFGAASRAANEGGSLSPPKHILNAPTKLMKQEGYGRGYAYDHSEDDAFSGQNYLPYSTACLRSCKPIPATRHGAVTSGASTPI